MDEDIAVGVVALGTAPGFIGLPTSPVVRLFSLPRPGLLSPSSSSAYVLDVEVMNRARIWSAAEGGLLHEVARTRAELGAGRSAARTDSAPCTLAHRASSRGAPTVHELTIWMFWLVGFCLTNDSTYSRVHCSPWGPRGR